jgi:hypothetical protein
MSWHGALHEAAYLVATLSWAIACLVFRRRFAALGQRGWARGWVATLVAFLVLSAWPDPGSLPIRIVVATALQFGLVVAMAAHLGRRLPYTTAAPPRAQ